MLALLFPGQGSFDVGMGRDAYENSAAAREIFDIADRSLGFSLTERIFDGPEEELRKTEIQQPAILTTSIALLRVLEETGPVRASFFAGHSLGEYTALVAANALGFEDAVRLVHARGSFMQEAVPEGGGAMAAILGLSAEDVSEVCTAGAQASEVVTPANFNSPQQTVIAGDTAAVERVCAMATDRGAKRAVPLAVSAPFHCQRMQPAAEKLELELGRIRFQRPSAPVVTNVEAVGNSDPARIPDLLKTQVTAPVRFVESVEFLVSQGVTHFLEVGPGGVLSGLVARIQRRTQRANFASMDGLDDSREFLINA